MATGGRDPAMRIGSAGVPSLSLRLLVPADSDVVAHWLANQEMDLPDALVSRIPGIVRTLFEDGRLWGVCVVRQSEGEEGTDITAVGLAGVVDDDCLETYLKAPTPRLLLALLERGGRCAKGPGLLGWRDIAKANSADGVNLFVFNWMQLEYNFGTEEGWNYLGFAYMMLTYYNRGFNVKQVLFEGWSEFGREIIGAGFRERHLFRAGTPVGLGRCVIEQERMLFGLTREEAKSGPPDSAASQLFMLRPAKARLSEGEARVLLLALDDREDREISEILGITSNAVKKKWDAIFKKVETELAFLLDDIDLHAEKIVKRAKKRQRILAHMKDNPQELRPWIWRRKPAIQH